MYRYAAFHQLDSAERSPQADHSHSKYSNNNYYFGNGEMVNVFLQYLIAEVITNQRLEKDGFVFFSTYYRSVKV